MGKVYDGIDERLAAWIGRQRLFFVGTAPSGAGGHVNVSPKGPIETLRILGPSALAFLDFAGSGTETVAHLRENGRIVVMLCAFEGPPRIVRLHGRGHATRLGDRELDRLLDELGLGGLPDAAAARSIVRVSVERVSDSCGYGVPLLRYEGERPQRAAWLDNRLRTGGPDAIQDYVATRNATSVDGLPATD